MLRNDTRLRCLDTDKCLDQVKAGSSVYVNVNLLYSFLIYLMDFLKTIRNSGMKLYLT